MKRIFTLMLGGLAMVAVALISAFLAMRLAIHGREALVPALTGLSIADASNLATRQGLQLNVENRFYSAGVPAGRILAQDPEPGARVRREWPVRVTESLGTQSINIPALTGESERAATVSIRRLSLELGVVAHLSVAGDPDIVLAQSPSPNSAGVDGPRVSLLVSDPDDAQAAAYVMPSLLGLSYTAAVARASTAGLRLIATSVQTPPTPVMATGPAAPQIQQPAASNGGLVLDQTPQPGHRVQQGDAVHVALSNAASSITTPPLP
jgi:eukaryotic-like serine/threonine-protein kinase